MQVNLQITSPTDMMYQGNRLGACQIIEDGTSCGLLWHAHGRCSGWHCDTSSRARSPYDCVWVVRVRVDGDG